MVKLIRKFLLLFRQMAQDLLLVTLLQYQLLCKFYLLLICLPVNADYSLVVTTLTFPRLSAGGTAIEFNVPITDDSLFEASETFGLSASSIGGLGVFSPGGDTATGVIVDNDGK